MDFSWSEDQDDLYRATVEFARGLGPIDADNFRARWKSCGEQGLLGVFIPPRYGGLGLDALTSARVMEALGYGCRDMGFVFSVAAHVYACLVPLFHCDSEALRERYLPAMVAGDSIGAHCITEPQAGSDAFGMQMRAERTGDFYLLNGSKCFASNAPIADVLIVHAVTAPGQGFLGISAFLVGRGSQGLSVSRPYKKIGLASAPLGDVFLEDCPVPADHRLGCDGQGAAVFIRSMNWERACLFAGYLGAMQRQLEESIAYAKERRQFGRPIKEFQAVSHRIVEMKLRLEAARWLVYRAAWLLDRSPEWKPSADSAMAKLLVSEGAVQSALDAVQIHGGLGVLEEGQVEHGLRDAVPSRIFSGTSEVQRNTIARALGL